MFCRRQGCGHQVSFITALKKRKAQTLSHNFRTRVLVVHFPFKNRLNERKVDEQDVLNLRRCLENTYKNCEFQAVHPQAPIESILDPRRLDEIFQSTTVPDVFILVILSHGNKDGLIESDNPDCPDFSTFAVWNALKKLPKECLKINFFGVSFPYHYVSFFYIIRLNFSHVEEISKKSICRLQPK
jgi:hypothetical protein